MMILSPSWKADACLLLCCALAIGVAVGVVFWMDSGESVSSDEALVQAEQSADRLCREIGQPDCDLTLLDAAASGAVSQGNPWQFKFDSPAMGLVTVEVRNDGKAYVMPDEQKRGAADKS